MPTGRDVVKPIPLNLPTLETEVIASMRAPLDQEELEKLKSEIDGESDDETPGAIPGNFPGSSTHNSNYY
jgi:hypothetical protein